MFMQHKAIIAADRYRDLDLNSRMMSASPHQLVSILYESLDTALSTAIAAHQQEKSTIVTIQTGRARSILLALDAGLDFERGAELAGSLAAIYRAMQRRISDVSDYPIALDDVRQGVAELMTSWNALSR
jgi:flagellar secretion chaperone FliS